MHLRSEIESALDVNLLSKIGDEPQQRKKVLRDADYWYHKGITAWNKKNVETAIECYKQALKLVRLFQYIYSVLEQHTLCITVQPGMLL